MAKTLIVKPGRKSGNPTNDTQDVYCQFDSFYFLVDFKSANPWGQQGDSKHAAYGYYTLAPGKSCKLTIGHENPKYPECEWMKCEGFIKCDFEEEMKEAETILKARMESKGNIYYNCDRPEGYLNIMHRKKREDVKWAVREEQLFLAEETEKYQELREKYLKIRKDQERRTRWGETLITDDCGTRRLYKVEPDVRRYVTSRDNEYEGTKKFRETDGSYKWICDEKRQNANSMMFWEYVLADKCIPKDFEGYLQTGPTRA
ncbi:hypothetical protein CRE_17319 [Caenorhabditis remanei]|uniref:Uncharacterized protein n=1 Tax=Caenorhabditis remanei TaxID=31234 RepID=E3MS46_CAERE|nr:hypothetical protein CRE_17319 [Caenorhabditis remanei]